MRITKDKIYGIDVIELTNQEVLDFLDVYKNSPIKAKRVEACGYLISGFIKLIASIANKFHAYTQDMEDIVYDGVAGFVTSLDKYDVNKNTKLITYAYMWIYQSIQRKLGLYKDIYVPEEVRLLYIDINNLTEQYKQDNGNKLPSRQYIAKTLNVSVAKVNNAIKACHAIYSLDKPMNDESESSFIDTIADNADMHKQLVLEDNRKQLNNELKNSLSSKEYYILIHFFGLNDNDKLQLDEIASNLNLSVARIKQLKLQALTKLKANKSLQQLCC